MTSPITNLFRQGPKWFSPLLGVRHFSGSAGLLRYHQDKVDNRKITRYGYKDQLSHFGPLPRITNESPRIDTKKVYRPEDPFSPSNALAGQNDYIDILGSDEFHPQHTHYHLPKWARGVERGHHVKALTKIKKHRIRSGFPEAFPEKFGKMQGQLKRYFKWQMVNLNPRKWSNYRGLKYGPVSDTHKTKYPF